MRPIRPCNVAGYVVALTAAASLSGASADDHADLAAQFGTLPNMRGLALSPDGSHISMLRMLDRDDIAAAFVLSMDGGFAPVLAGRKDRFEISWCDWANADRLLCGASGIGRSGGAQYVETRLIAVDRDGSHRKVMLQDALQRAASSSLVGTARIAQFQDDVVDWLPDDPRHVLVELPDIDGGTGVVRLNIDSGQTSTENRAGRDVYDWVADGHGNVRLRLSVAIDKLRWDYRRSPDGEWRLLHDSAMDDLDDRFVPEGFGENPDELLVFMPHDGRMALWSRNLRENDGEYRIVHAHPDVDLQNLLRLGKYRRIVGITYATDRPHYNYFDERAQQILAALQPTFPDSGIAIVDESWDRTVYLLHVSDAASAGNYYRFEPASRSLVALPMPYPKLAGRKLAPMVPIEYTARDGVEIPGYLTHPLTPAGKNGYPTVILPHGGPGSRDVLGYDWLVQFLAASGYAVLQVNFRGSGGYGADWAGEGGFRAWQQTIADITDGTNYLLDDGIAAPGRTCIVGWSYGGYAALMSVIEEPELYACVVSIAGVTDPKMTIGDSRFFISRRATRALISKDAAVLEQGSPLHRANEIRVPALMFHGDEDINVNVRQSRKLHQRLKKAGRKSELRIYDDAEHSIESNRYRIDMLDRLGRFLARHTAAGA